MKRNENFITLHSVINGQKLDLYPKTVAQQVYVNGNTLNKELNEIRKGIRDLVSESTANGEKYNSLNTKIDEIEKDLNEKIDFISKTISSLHFNTLDIGKGSLLTDESLFTIGNGDNLKKSNAFAVFKDGHAEINTVGKTDNSIITKKYFEDYLHDQNEFHFIEYTDSADFDYTKFENGLYVAILRLSNPAVKRYLNFGTIYYDRDVFDCPLYSQMASYDELTLRLTCKNLLKNNKICTTFYIEHMGKTDNSWKPFDVSVILPKATRVLLGFKKIC